MGRKKMTTVRDLHRETLDAQRLRRQVPVLKDSAFDALEQNNKAFLAEKRRLETGYGDEETIVKKRVRKPARKKKRAILKKKHQKKSQAKATARTPTKAVEKPLDVWRPADGEHLLPDDQENNALAVSKISIATVHTSMVDKFCKTLKMMMAKHGWAKELEMEDIMFGGELHINVYTGFESKEDADDFMTDINGEMVDGRKLHMEFAY